MQSGTLAATLLCATAPAAQAGHEVPYYPSFYPQEIRIEPLDVELPDPRGYDLLVLPSSALTSDACPKAKARVEARFGGSLRFRVSGGYQRAGLRISPFVSVSTDGN